MAPCTQSKAQTDHALATNLGLQNDIYGKCAKLTATKTTRHRTTRQTEGKKHDVCSAVRTLSKTSQSRRCSTQCAGTHPGDPKCARLGQSNSRQECRLRPPSAEPRSARPRRRPNLASPSAVSTPLSLVAVLEKLPKPSLELPRGRRAKNDDCFEKTACWLLLWGGIEGVCHPITPRPLNRRHVAEASPAALEDVEDLPPPPPPRVSGVKPRRGRERGGLPLDSITSPSSPSSSSSISSSLEIERPDSGDPPRRRATRRRFL